MEKDKYYLEACEDAKEMAMHGYHWTQEVVESRAEYLREQAREKLAHDRSGKLIWCGCGCGSDPCMETAY